MKKEIRTGIIGFGMSGRYFHAPFIHSHPGFTLASVVERSSQESASVYPYVTVARNHNELISDPTIDLVVIGTPNKFHFPMSRQALEAGKHVVVEKPFTPTTGEADKLMALAEKMNKKIFVYQNRRWDGDFLTIRKVVQQGLLGEILDYEARFDRFRPLPSGKAWRETPDPGSGVLFDLSPHLVDQALLLFGKPLAVWADIRTQRPGGKVDDYFEIKLFYDQLKVTLKAGVFVKEATPRYMIHGRKGSFVKYGLDPQEEMLRQGLMPGGEDWGKEDPFQWGVLNTEKDGKDLHGPVETEAGNYMGFYDNVFDVLANGDRQEVLPEEARANIRIIELALQSQEKRKIIDYSDQ